MRGLIGNEPGKEHASSEQQQQQQQQPKNTQSCRAMVSLTSVTENTYKRCWCELRREISSQALKEFMQANHGVAVDGLKFGEIVMIDVTEALGKFVVVSTLAGVLQMVQQQTMYHLPGGRQTCIVLYRGYQKDCQDIDAARLAEEAETNQDALDEYCEFMIRCTMLAAVHHCIFDKPMKVYRLSDISQQAQSGAHTSTTGSRPTRIRGSDVEDQDEQQEASVCHFKPDGSIMCMLNSHMLHVGREGIVGLDLISILGLHCLVLMFSPELDQAIDHYKHLLKKDRQAVQQEYRIIYTSCMGFTKLRNKTITPQQWIQFQKDCTRLVALRKALHNKDVPWLDRDDFKASAPMFGSKLDNNALIQSRAASQKLVASVLEEDYADGSSSHQHVENDVESDVEGEGTISGFRRTAKAEALHGKLCLSGNENTQSVNILFKDIAHDPEMTIMYEDVLGVNLVCVTDGITLMDMLDKARHHCKVDRQGAELLCDQLMKACLQQNPNQLMDFVQIGDKKAYKAYQVLLEECMLYMVLKCVIDGTPIKIRVGRGDLQVPPFEQADVVVSNDSEDGCCAIYFTDNPIVCYLTYSV